MHSSQEIISWLEEVKDPEIPVLSLVDLGVITRVSIAANGAVEVIMTPTFTGCPAMDYMKRDVEATLHKYGIEQFTVTVNFDEPWTSDRITEKGRKALKDFGLAPPPLLANQLLDLDFLDKAACPHCNSTNTELKTPFGPTLCRSMHYCNNCKQMFQQFKPL